MILHVVCTKHKQKKTVLIVRFFLFWICKKKICYLPWYIRKIYYQWGSGKWSSNKNRPNHMYVLNIIICPQFWFSIWFLRALLGQVSGNFDQMPGITLKSRPKFCTLAFQRKFMSYNVPKGHLLSETSCNWHFSYVIWPTHMPPSVI